MLMIGFLLFLASSLLIIKLKGFEEDKLIDWVMNWRLAREQSAHEEVTFEETVEKFGEADESTREDSHVPVTLLDSDVLECPICCEPLKIPIFQCKNGHLACSLCCKRVKKVCPSCKSPIGYNRCRAMEKVIEATRVSCPNAKHGCTESSVFGNSPSHEMQCLFAPCSCPIRDCSYTGSYKDLYNHVRAIHKDNDLVRFIWDIRFVIEWDINKKIAILQEEEDGQLIVVQVFNRPHGLVVSVSCIAPLAPRVSSFSCTLEFATLGIRLKQALMLRIIQKARDEQPEYGFMLIPSYMLPSDGNLKMSICISPGQVHLIHAN